MSISPDPDNRKESRRQNISKKSSWSKLNKNEDTYFNKKATKTHKKEMKQKIEEMLEDEIWNDWEEYNK
jgi:hypothetical protein